MIVFVATIGAALAVDRTARKAPSDRSVERSARSVTAVTDTLIDAASRGGQMVGGLASLFDARSGVRVLALAGRGGESNLKDLLYLRGVDFAVVNADVMASLDGMPLGEVAKRELRYVTKLFDQRVLLLARPSITSIQDLAGKAVGVRAERPDAQTTAQTLFRLLKVGARVEPLVLNPNAEPKQDAVLLLESELPQVGDLAGGPGGYRLLPIPFDDRLSVAYRAAQVPGRELARWTAGRAVATVRVDTILAVYNWSNTSPRRPDVVAFIDAFYAKLAQFRQGAEGVLWRQIGVAAEVPGWTRYVWAEPSRYLEPDKLAELAAVSRAAFKLSDGPPLAEEMASAQQIDAKLPPSLTILAFERPPFSSKQLPDGGPALKMVRDALAARNAAQPPTVEWVGTLGDEPLLRLIEGNRFDVIVPWPYFPCDQPARLTGPTAHVCDSASFTKPLLTDMLRLFLPATSTVTLADPTTLAKRRICLTDPAHIAIITATNGDWERRYEVEYSVQPSVVACLSAVQQGEADGVVASEAECQHTLDALGIRKLFKFADEPVGIQSWIAVVPSDREPELLADLDSGIERAHAASAGKVAAGERAGVDAAIASHPK